MVQILQSAFFEALGWSLVDSLWQNGLLWGTYCLFTLNGRKYSAAIRHNLAFLALLSGTAWFFISIFVNYQNVIHDRNLFSLSYLMNEEMSRTLADFLSISTIAPALSFIYILLFFAYTTRVIQQYWVGTDLFGSSFHTAADALNNRLLALNKLVGTGRNVAVRISQKIHTPLTVGALKPIILLPLAALNQLSTHQVEAVLVHELQHVKRNDYLLNMLVVFSEMLLFFNPFTRLLSGIIKNEREHSCDDGVLSLGYDAWSYSQALYILGRNNSAEAQFMLAATGPNKKILLNRIKRMLRITQPAPSFAKPLVSFFLCLFVAFIAGRNSSESTETVTVQSVGETNSPGKLILIRPEPITPEESRKESRNSPTPPIAKNESRTTTREKALKPPESSGSMEPESVPAIAFPVFVDDMKVIEFTIIEPEIPEVPQVITREHPLPYVPGSTFYLPVDSLKMKTAPKKIVRI